MNLIKNTIKLPEMGALLYKKRRENMMMNLSPLIV